MYLVHEELLYYEKKYKIENKSLQACPCITYLIIITKFNSCQYFKSREPNQWRSILLKAVLDWNKFMIEPNI